MVVFRNMWVALKRAGCSDDHKLQRILNTDCCNDVMENDHAVVQMSRTPHVLVQIIGQVLVMNAEAVFQHCFASSPAGFDIVCVHTGGRIYKVFIVIDHLVVISLLCNLTVSAPAVGPHCRARQNVSLQHRCKPCNRTFWYHLQKEFAGLEIDSANNPLWRHWTSLCIFRLASCNHCLVNGDNISRSITVGSETPTWCAASCASISTLQ